MQDYGLDPEKVEEAARPPGLPGRLRRATHRAGSGPRGRGLARWSRDGHSRARVAQAHLYGRDGARGHDPHATAPRRAGRGGRGRDRRRGRGVGYRLVRRNCRANGSRAGRYQHNPWPRRTLARHQGHRRRDEGPRRRPHPGARTRSVREARRRVRDGGLAEDDPGLLFGDGSRRGAGGVRGARPRGLTISRAAPRTMECSS